MIELAVVCAACETRAVHEVGAVLLDADELDLDAPGGGDDVEAWTRAVYVAMSLRCPSCGAVDEHRVEPESARRLKVDGEAVREGRAALSDGTAIYNPSQGIRLLRGRAEAKPNEAQGWRALGNFALRAGRSDEALVAWQRGAEVDGELECALAVAVDGVARAVPGAAQLVVRALERLVHADRARRPLQAAHIAELVRQLAASPEGALIITADGERIEATGVRDWSGFGERLTTAKTLSAERA